MQATVSLAEVRAVLGANLLGERGAKEASITAVSPLGSAPAGSITFCKKGGRTTLALVERTNATVVICGPELADAELPLEDKTLLLVDNPRLEFIRIVRAFFAKPLSISIHPTAVIDPEAKVGRNVHVGPHCVIGKAVIGDDCVLLGNNIVMDDVTLGKHVLLKPGAVIGAEGLGFEQEPNGEWLKFPHLGGVIIEDHVEIGGNTCVDRGTLGLTHIKAGTKIDSLVHVTHNTTIGRNCIVATGARFSGGTTVGDEVWIGTGAILNNGITVGDRSWLGIGTVVTKSLPAGSRVVPVPSKVV